MENKEFYSSLGSLPKTYNSRVSCSSNQITVTPTRGNARGVTFNPVTAVAYQKTGSVYGTNKRETLKAGRALGLTREFTGHVYDASSSVFNRGNAQVVRGKIRSALEI